MAKEAPKQAPGSTLGNNTPKHNPTVAAPMVSTWSATIAKGIPTDENNGSMKLYVKQPPSNAEQIPEYSLGLLWMQE